MDMQVETNERSLGPEDAPALTFSWLYGQVQTYASTTIYPKASRLERWSLWIGLAATALGLLLAALPASLLPVIWAIKMLRVCLAIELAGFALSFLLMAKREGRQFVKPRLSHAEEMDAAFEQWETLLDRLREFPCPEREQRLRYVNQLRANMVDRMGLMYGGLQKLGPFPVLVALYLQFRNWKWGDWAGAFDVNLVAGILIFAMLLMYAAGWVLVSIRVSLDTYAHLFEASMSSSAPKRLP